MILEAGIIPGIHFLVVKGPEIKWGILAYSFLRYRMLKSNCTCSRLEYYASIRRKTRTPSRNSAHIRNEGPWAFVCIFLCVSEGLGRKIPCCATKWVAHPGSIYSPAGRVGIAHCASGRHVELYIATDQPCMSDKCYNCIGGTST